VRIDPITGWDLDKRDAQIKQGGLALWLLMTDGSESSKRYGDDEKQIALEELNKSGLTKEMIQALHDSSKTLDSWLSNARNLCK
jgi:hypothetical protein